MIPFADVCLFAALSASPIAPPAVDALPQGPTVSSNGIATRGAAPGGGTPEPATMLLLAGGALGYGAYRMRRPRNGERKDA